MAIEAFSNITFEISDGNTVPSIELLGYKTFVDIGSGTVFKLSWQTPTAANNKVASYRLLLYTYDIDTSISKNILNADVGDVNEFFVTADLLQHSIRSQYKVYVQLTVHSCFGATYDGVSEVIPVTVSKGCGTYMKVETGYPQPVMKRAIGFAKLGYKVLLDANGNPLKDAFGEVLYVKTARAQGLVAPVEVLDYIVISDIDNNLLTDKVDTSLYAIGSSTQDIASGWTLMQEFHAKDTNNQWKNSDIRYEVLVDTTGAIITDVNNEPIYIL